MIMPSVILVTFSTMVMAGMFINWCIHGTPLL
jgi:hypothetical protein